MSCLSEVARVRAGQTFRGKAEDPSRTEGVRLAQIKDIREVGTDLANLPFAAVEPQKIKDGLLRDGDILIPLRGGRFEAMVCYGVDDKPTITTNQVAIIRADSDFVKVDYLCWYLNSNLGRTRLAEYQVGSVQLHIGLKDLNNFKVPVPDFVVQEKISRIYRNWLSRKAVLEQMLQNGVELTEKVCVEMVEGV